MRNPLAAHPPWRQLTIIAVLLPLMIVLAVLAFAWPAARIAPRHLPIGIVGTGPGSQQVVSGLTRSDPGGFDARWYASEASARSAIEDRGVYGAFAVGADGITVLEASAASPAVAQPRRRRPPHRADRLDRAGAGGHRRRPSRPGTVRRAQGLEAVTAGRGTIGSSGGGDQAGRDRRGPGLLIGSCSARSSSATCARPGSRQSRALRQAPGSSGPPRPRTRRSPPRHRGRRNRCR